MKPIYAKTTFWRRLATYHPTIIMTAMATAFRSGRVFRAYQTEQAGLAARFPNSAETTAHPFWADAFASANKSVHEVLEIGAFEGRTTVTAAELFPAARITCIDPWLNYAETTHDLPAAEAAFRKNVAPFGARIRALKGYSTTRLPELLAASERFDLIFVDGSHRYEDVLLDSLFAWRLLNVGGVLIWDDYLWRKAEYGRRVPKLAIDQFLSGHRGDFTPLFAFKQVAIRKRR